MPGPPPKNPSERRRRNATLAMTQLPAEGRKGPAPEWPIGRPTQAENQLWQEVWRTPQAVVWERQSWIRTVARYVRIAVRSEKKDAPSSLAGEARQLEDRLGLTPMAMMRLRWEIVADEISEARDESETKSTRRLKAVDPKGAEPDAVAGS